MWNKACGSRYLENKGPVMPELEHRFDKIVAASNRIKQKHWVIQAVRE
jgi:hypothetical protein